jgi:hypothetical protein
MPKFTPITFSRKKLLKNSLNKFQPIMVLQSMLQNKIEG